MTFKNMKFRVKDKEHSRLIQEALFTEGYSWDNGGTEYYATDAPYLFTSNNANITYDATRDSAYFDNHTNLEYSYILGEFVLAHKQKAPFIGQLAPPLGIMARKMVNEVRLTDILEACTRYVAVGKQIPEEWLTELSDLNKWLA